MSKHVHLAIRMDGFMELSEATKSLRIICPMGVGIDLLAGRLSDLACDTHPMELARHLLSTLQAVEQVQLDIIAAATITPGESYHQAIGFDPQGEKVLERFGDCCRKIGYELPAEGRERFPRRAMWRAGTVFRGGYLEHNSPLAHLERFMVFDRALRDLLEWSLSQTWRIRDSFSPETK